MRYEKDDKTFPAPAYKIQGYAGVACFVLGWEVEANEDTEWTGMYDRTGKIVAVMVGDDRKFTADPDDLTPLTEDGYCPGCGQTGCHCYR